MINQTKQKGAIVLTMTSILVLAALILSLGSYKSTFYQIKRAQNEVKAKQGMWKAEGALECSFSSLINSGKGASPLLPSLPSDCHVYSSPLEDFSVTQTNDVYTISATSLNQTIKKSFTNDSLVGKGSIQAVGDLKLVGTVVLSPDSLNEKVSGTSDYKCVSVAFSDTVTFEYSSTHGFASRPHGLEVTNPIKDGPFEGFNGNCHSDYKTIISKTTESITASSVVASGNPPPFKKDFVADLNLDPFNNLFKLPKSPANILAISQDPSLFVYKDITNATSCGTEISNHFKGANKDKGLWLNGHCYINTPIDLQSNKSQILVIQNGAFSLYGALNFKGTTYHLVDMSDTAVATSISSYWSGLSTPNVFSPLVESNTTSIMFFSSAPKGGVIYDAKGGQSVLVGDIDLDFYAETNPFYDNGVYKWQKGSWNDL